MFATVLYTLFFRSNNRNSHLDPSSRNSYSRPLRSITRSVVAMTTCGENQKRLDTARIVYWRPAGTFRTNKIRMNLSRLYELLRPDPSSSRSPSRRWEAEKLNAISDLIRASIGLRLGRIMGFTQSRDYLNPKCRSLQGERKNFLKILSLDTQKSRVIQIEEYLFPTAKRLIF